LAQLGSGITIAQNPIENEKMLAKYQMGADHLFDYLEKRMLDYGELEIPEAYLPEDLDAIKEKDRNRRKQEENAKNLQLNLDDGFATSGSARYTVKNPLSPPSVRSSNSFMNPSPPGAALGVRGSSSFLNPAMQNNNNNNNNNNNRPTLKPAAAPAMASDDIISELSTKMVLLKNWAVSAIRGELQPKFSRINGYLGRTTNTADVMPWAQFAKNMKPEIEKGKTYLPLIPMDPHRAAPAGADRLTILKILVSTVLDDICYMLEVFLKILQEAREANQILGIVAFLKELKRELSYVDGKLNSA